MSALIRNIAENTDLDTLTIPTRPDGSYYRYEMVCEGGRTRLYDDSIVGLLTHLIPGYTALNDQQRLTARTRHAVDLQVRIQAQLNTFFAAYPRTDAENAILFAPRHQPPQTDLWSCAVPLVLVDTFYAPYADLPTPTSELADTDDAPNVWWLRPAAGDMEYLRSLHLASVIDLNITKDEAL